MGNYYTDKKTTYWFTKSEMTVHGKSLDELPGTPYAMASIWGGDIMYFTGIYEIFKFATSNY